MREAAEPGQATWVVVPGYNEEAWIGSTIDSLAAQGIAEQLTVLRTLGKPERLLWLPAGPVGAAALVMEAACGFGRGPRPPIARFQLSHLTRDFVYDLTEAREQLGYAPAIDLPEGLATVELP